MILFLRIFLVTFGLIFLGIGGLVLHAATSDGADQNLAYAVLAGIMVALGIAFVLAGFVCRPQTIERWSDAITVHEASLIMMVIAAPVYLVAKLFSSPKRLFRASDDIRGHGLEPGRTKRSRRRKRV